MMILHPPVCSVPGIYLRQLAAQDILPWYAMLSMPEVFQHTSWNLQQADDLQPLLAAYESPLPDSPMRLALVDAGTQSLVGTIGFHSISRLNRSAEIAYEIAPEYWGQGIASSICRDLCAWGFAEQNFFRIQATTLLSNQRSSRVLEKTGFRHEGVLRGFRQVRGVAGDFNIFSRLLSDA